MTDHIEDEARPEEDWDGFTGAQTDLEDQSLHTATLTKLTKKVLPSSFSETGKAPAIIWTFALEPDGVEVDGTSSEATGPKSKARPWLDALVGKTKATELLRGTLRKDQIIGRQCQVLISINDNGYPKVSTVLPYKGQKPEVAPSPTPAPKSPQEAPSAFQEAVPPLPEWEK